MKTVQYTEVILQGATPRYASVINLLTDVPEQCRAYAIPSWAGSYRVKRHLFNWLDRLGRVNLYMLQVEPGVFQYSVRCPFFKPWLFYLTPELVYMVANIMHGTQLTNGLTDFLINFRERKMFLPIELHARFYRSLFVIARMHPARIISIHHELRNNEAEQETGAEQAPTSEAKRVLH